MANQVAVPRAVERSEGPTGAFDVPVRLLRGRVLVVASSPSGSASAGFRSVWKRGVGEGTHLIEDRLHRARKAGPGTVARMDGQTDAEGHTAKGGSLPGLDADRCMHACTSSWASAAATERASKPSASARSARMRISKVSSALAVLSQHSPVTFGALAGGRKADGAAQPVEKGGTELSEGRSETEPALAVEVLVELPGRGCSNLAMSCRRTLTPPRPCASAGRRSESRQIRLWRRYWRHSRHRGR